MTVWYALADRIIADVPTSAETYKPLIFVAVGAGLLILIVSAAVIIRNRK